MRSTCTSTGSTVAIYDAVLAAAASILRELCGEDWEPSEVLLHASGAGRHGALSPVLQGAGALRCGVRRPALSRELARAADRRGRPGPAAPTRARRLSAASKATIVQLASRALRTLLLHGKGSGDDVAQALAMHRRTLNRRLSAEGTTFQQVLDRVRFAVAKEMLEDSQASIPEIAASLGYADYVSFTRAFKRWTGTRRARGGSRHDERK